MHDFTHHDYETGHVTAGRTPMPAPFAPPLVDRVAVALVQANPARFGGRKWSELPIGHQDVLRREAAAAIRVATEAPSRSAPPKFDLDAPFDSLTQLSSVVSEAILERDADVRGFVFLSRGLEAGAVSFGYEWDEDGAGTALGELLGNANAIGRIYGIEFGVQETAADEDAEGGVFLP